VGSWDPAAIWQMPLGMRVEKRGLEGGSLPGALPRAGGSPGALLRAKSGWFPGPEAWYWTQAQAVPKARRRGTRPSPGLGWEVPVPKALKRGVVLERRRVVEG